MTAAATQARAAAQHDRMSDPGQDPQEHRMSAQTTERPADQPRDQQPADLPEEPLQPAEAVTEEEMAEAANVVTLAPREKVGALTLRPGQTVLDEHQRGALVAIGIDVQKDPMVVSQIRPFMHMCQVRGLDPWAREAYLIGRGKGENRKWTMQVGIDGYRKMAQATGRFIRVAKVLWTGADDDDRTWRETRDEDGDVVMQRVWFDQWPEGRGNPGAAKVVVEHYDTQGVRTRTSAIADWKFYAPYKDRWDRIDGRNQKVIGPDGKPVQDLTEMWAKGGPFMLAKAAEALAYRKAFPAAMNGVYVTEEMHRLDVTERARGTEKRTRAYVEATGGREPREVAPPVAHEETAQQEPPRAEPAEAPARVAEVAQEVAESVRGARDVVDADVVEEGPRAPERAPEAQQDAVARAREAVAERAPAPLDEATRARLLRAEMVWHGEVLGFTAERLAERTCRARGVSYDALATDDVLTLVRRQRPTVIARLRAAGEHGLAEGLIAAADEVADTSVIRGGAGNTEDDRNTDPAADPRLDADPASAHEYVDDGGACAVCGCFTDEPIHQH